MTAQRNITDRAHRYRAQSRVTGPRKCLFCGSTRNLVPDHWDGHPDHTNPANLEVLCKSCNTTKGAAFSKAGRGRLTHQFNPTKGGGAANVGEWMQAVGSITPHIDRGDRGLVSAMTTQAAVDMIRATPQSKRRDFAAKLRRHNPWPFSSKGRRAGDTTPASGGIAHHSKGVPSLKREAKASKPSASDKREQKKYDLDTGKLKAHYARGGTLAEFLQTNPATLKRGCIPNPTWYHGSRSGDPLVIGGSRGNYGGALFLAKDPTYAQPYAAGGLAENVYAVNVPKGVKTFNTNNARHVAALAKWLQKNYDEYAENMTSENLRDQLAVDDLQSNSLYDEQQVQEGIDALGFRAVTSGARGELMIPDPESVRLSVKPWKKAKANPATGAAEAYEDFHGHASEELVTVKKKVHHHEHLASAGTLEKLRIKPVNGGEVRTLKGFGKRCFLAFNESKNQLFVEGGDQALDGAELKRFGIAKAHELETLGKLTGVEYFTDKSHLGDEGGSAVYDHSFRMTNKNGKHVVVTISRYPDVIYRVLDEQLEFAGGSYSIRAEGIDV